MAQSVGPTRCMIRIQARACAMSSRYRMLGSVPGARLGLPNLIALTARLAPAFCQIARPATIFGFVHRAMGALIST